jgi:tRNA U34 2-thiouridine synthase MnmA/TrmU
VEVQFKEPVESVTPGQAMVFYDPVHPEKVLGGAWIDGVSAM